MQTSTYSRHHFTNTMIISSHGYILEGQQYNPMNWQTSLNSVGVTSYAWVDTDSKPEVLLSHIKYWTTSNVSLFVFTANLD